MMIDYTFLYNQAGYTMSQDLVLMVNKFNLLVNLININTHFVT